MIRVMTCWPDAARQRHRHTQLAGMMVITNPLIIIIISDPNVLPGGNHVVLCEVSCLSGSVKRMAPWFQKVMIILLSYLCRSD